MHEKGTMLDAKDWRYVRQGVKMRFMIMQEIDLFEKVIKQESGKWFKMAVLRANVLCDPNMIEAINANMDSAVSEYVRTKGHNTFVEELLVTPNY